jgi:Na+/proline symporter
VAGPAIALMILSVISITLLGIRMVAQLIAPEFFNSFASQENPQIAAFAQKFGMIVCICAIVMNIFVLVGAMKMKNLQNYTLAIVATILVMLPCNCPCCILGLPIGIWSLIVLLNSDVKAAFPS